MTTAFTSEAQAMAADPPWPTHLPPSPLSALLQAAHDSLDALPQWLEQHGAQLLQGQTLAELRQVPLDELERQYAFAYELCQQERWDDALPILLNLVAHNPMDAAWHFACGMCFQQLNEPVPACISYSQALLLEPDDAACAFRLGEAMNAAGQPQGARDAATTAVALIKANYDRYHHLLVPAQDLLERIEVHAAGAGHG